LGSGVKITNLYSNNEQQPASHGQIPRNAGFTLIELIVVIALMGLMLFFSLPKFQNNPFLNDTKKSSRWLIRKVQTLRESALRDQKRYTLHFDLDSGRVWETNEAMSPEDIESTIMDSYELNKALVHMQDDDTYLSFLIEPFLSNVEFFYKYASFDD